MRKIINSTYVSLDGVVEAPQDWPSGKHVDDGRGATLQTDLLMACDAVLMGRRTYEGFAPVWSGMSGDPMSDRMNSIRKYVVSSTLRAPEWNNSVVIADDPVAAITRLKEEPGKDIVQYGFGPLSHALMAAGQLDELRLWVHPFFVGRGKPEDLVFRECPVAMFDLADAQVLTSGIVVLFYRRAAR